MLFYSSLKVLKILIIFAIYKIQKGENFYTSNGGVTSDEVMTVLVSEGRILGMSMSDWEKIERKGEAYSRKIADGYLKKYQGDKSIVYKVYCNKFIAGLLKQNLPPELILARSQAIVNHRLKGEPAKIWNPTLTKFLKKHNLPEDTLLKDMSKERINDLINMYFQQQRRDYIRIGTKSEGTKGKFYKGWLSRNKNSKKIIASFRDSQISDKLEDKYNLDDMLFSVNNDGKIEIKSKK